MMEAFPAGRDVLWSVRGGFRYGRVQSHILADRCLLSVVCEGGISSGGKPAQKWADHVVDAASIVVPMPGDLLLWMHGPNTRSGPVISYDWSARLFTVEVSETKSPHRIGLELVVGLSKGKGQ